MGQLTDLLLQRHFANLSHVRQVFRIDSRAQRGSGQIAPYLGGVVYLVHPAFPGAFNFSSPEVRTFALPAAGANFQITVPPNEIWRVLSMRIPVTNSAAAGTRTFQLEFHDTVSSFFRIPPASTKAANAVSSYSYGIKQGYEKDLVETMQGLPDIVLQSGWQINSVYNNIQGADQIGAQVVLIEVFPS